MLTDFEIPDTPIDLPSLPEGWRYELLQDLVEGRGICYGIVQPGVDTTDGIPTIRVNNLRGGRIDTTDVMRVDDGIESKYCRSRLVGGEVLLSLVGTLGQVAVVPDTMKGWNVARAVGVLPVRSDPSSQWVALCLRSGFLQHCIRTWATTSVQATLNLREVAKLPIPIPPRETREEVLRILGALDDKIELNRRRNATLEAMARALFQSWFVDFDPVHAKAAGRQPAGMDVATAELFPDAFQASELGEIPYGWTAKPLPAVIEVNPPRKLSKGSIAPYLDMKNLPTQGHSADHVVDREFGSGAKFRNGDTLLARITPCLENGKTGFVDFLKDGQVGWGSTEYIVLSPKDPLPPEFGYLLARSEKLRTHAIQNMTGTSGRQRVPAECFNSFFVAMPPPEVASCFGVLVAPLFASIKSNSNQSRVLAALRDSLLPKLLGGDLGANARKS